ncbi:hypothetical protein [Verrucomicrobium spinosum]|uniref:hypothetical protein n=1 Tax=Verrucomicrobium spinosum TaxID=2736 RepID=UPI001C484F2C|nr:hypothetical protein [Verrucomicrobium spinosum]
MMTEQERQQVRLERAQLVEDGVKGAAPVKRALPKGLRLWVYAPLMPDGLKRNTRIRRTRFVGGARILPKDGPARTCGAIVSYVQARLQGAGSTAPCLDDQIN